MTNEDMPHGVMVPGAPPKKGGMFGSSGFGFKEALAFGLAGLAARQNPALLQGLMGAMLQKKRQEADEANYQRERGDRMSDWMTQQNWKLEHPDPTNPHYFESNSGDVYAINGMGQQPVQVFKDPLRIKWMPNGMGGLIPVNVDAYTGGGQQGAKPLTDEDIDKMAGGAGVAPPRSFLGF